MTNSWIIATLLLLITTVSAVADTPQLQGTVEQNDTASNRISAPLEGQAAQPDMQPLAPPLKVQAQTDTTSGVIDANSFVPPTAPQPPYNGYTQQSGYVQPQQSALPASPAPPKRHWYSGLANYLQQVPQQLPAPSPWAPKPFESFASQQANPAAAAYQARLNEGFDPNDPLGLERQKLQQEQAQPQQMAYQQPPIAGNTRGGQDEEWIDWQPWLNRMAALICNTLQSITPVVYGGSKSHFEVTVDHRIKLLDVENDNDGRMYEYMTEAARRLNGNPEMTFPAGSHKQVATCTDVMMGVAGWFPMGPRYVGSHPPEHIFRQW